MERDLRSDLQPPPPGKTIPGKPELERVACLDSYRRLPLVDDAHRVEPQLRAFPIELYWDAWTALCMIRDAVETLGPPGLLASSKPVPTLYGPDPIHEGQTIVDALTKLLKGRITS